MKPINKLSLELTAQLLPVVREIEPTIDRITEAGISEDGVIVCTAQTGKAQGKRTSESIVEHRFSRRKTGENSWIYSGVR
jgi:hypothetical protein